MRYILVAFIGVLGLLMTGDAQQQEKVPTKVARKWIESITWSPDTAGGELVWVVATGELKPDGKVVKIATQTFKISPGDCVMSYNGEKRGFERQEGQEVRALLALLHSYTIVSSIWWDQGNGFPVGKDGKPIFPPSPPSKAPVPVEKSTPTGAKVRAALDLRPISR